MRATLPHRANIHYLGPQPYAELPRFVAGWDVCLLPFVVNAQTRYMSPTKVLEYMAAEKPIVSTPVVDVLESYSHVVHVGRHAQAFVGACERALEEGAAARERRAGMMRNVVDGHVVGFDRGAHARAHRGGGAWPAPQARADRMRPRSRRKLGAWW